MSHDYPNIIMKLQLVYPKSRITNFSKYIDRVTNKIEREIQKYANKNERKKGFLFSVAIEMFYCRKRFGVVAAAFVAGDPLLPISVMAIGALCGCVGEAGGEKQRIWR